MWRAPLPLRLLGGFVFEVVSAAAVVGIPGAWLLRHADWGRAAAAQASTALGRPVQVGSLRIGLHPSVTLEAADVAVANLGGAAPAFATVGHLTATLDRAALLRGRVELLRVEAEGVSLHLEKTAAGVRNWRFGPGPPVPPAVQRARFPSLRDVHLTGSEVVYRLASGRDLVTKLDDAAITTTGDDQPVQLTVAGSYNGTPVALHADLQPIDALRDGAAPYGTVLRLQSGTARLEFDGTMTDPLNFNGLRGRLRLDAEDPRPVFAIAGSATGPDVPVHLDGAFQHDEPGWHLQDAKGRLGQDEVERASLDLREGDGKDPDALTLDVALASLNLNELLGHGARGARGDADTPLAASETPSTLIRGKVSAGRVAYGPVNATAVTAAGAQTPGKIVLETLALEAFGARWTAHGAVDAVGDGRAGHLTAQVSTAGAEVQPLASALGLGRVPVEGRLEAEVVVDATAATMNAAAREARISAVVAMRGGSVQRQIVDKASLNVLSLFRTNEGTSPVTCLLAGVDIRSGQGVVAPLRLRAADGTIAGSARFDLGRRTFDLTIGSERATTGVFALDIPIRVSGPFGSPSVSPAQWSAQGRAQLAAADSLSALPPTLRDWAKRFPCPPSR